MQVSIKSTTILQYWTYSLVEKNPITEPRIGHGIFWPVGYPEPSDKTISKLNSDLQKTLDTRGSECISFLLHENWTVAKWLAPLCLHKVTFLSQGLTCSAVSGNTCSI